MLAKMLISAWIMALVATPVMALNIVLGTTDSWVHKNVRLLHRALVENDHNVVMVGPLYKHNEEDILDSIEALEDRVQSNKGNEITDGGDFGHLLQVHQTYYRTIKRLNSAKRGAKNVLTKKSLDEISNEKTNSAICNRFFGSDPLDSSVWYVNADPKTSLLIGLDVILPQYYPDFKPDVILIGPNEGLGLTHKTLSNSSMMEVLKLGMMKNIPTIGVSSEDSHDIYFQDEHFFNAQETTVSKILKRNIFGKNIKFVNKKVIELLNSIKWDNFSPRMAMNVNFPSINHDNSYCYTTESKMKTNVNPNFKNIVYSSRSPEFVDQKLPKLAYSKQRGLHSKGFYAVDIDSQKQPEKPIAKRADFDDVDEVTSTFVDEKSYYYLQTVKNYAKSTLASIETGTKSMLIEKRDADHAESRMKNDEYNSASLEDINAEEANALRSCQIPVNILSLSRGTGIKDDFFL